MDLVRGSTFPKAKPKQSTAAVLYLSLLRYFFLPLYARWWVKETSAKVFVLLLTLYLVQMVNWAIYSLHVRLINDDDKADEDSVVPLCELLVPMGLSLLLCFVHSQIVATTVTSSRSSSKRRTHKLSLNRTGSDKVRRKKKAGLRMRPTTVDLNLLKGYDSDEDPTGQQYHSKSKLSIKAKVEPEIIQNSSKKFELAKPAGCLSSTPSSERPDLIKRRNVNWESPIRSSMQANPVFLEERRRRVSENVTGDDGFESLTGKSSSGEDNLLRQPLVSDSETDTLRNSEHSSPVKACKKLKESSDTDEENDDVESHPFGSTDGEYIGVTSNSDSDCLTASADDENDAVSPTTILNPNNSNEKVSCTLWTKHEAKKAEMSVLDISMAIIQRVDSIPETCDYVYIGLVLSLLLSLTPTYCRLCDNAMDSNSTGIPHIIFDLPRVMMEDSSSVSLTSFIHLAFGRSSWEKTLLMIATAQRLVLAFLFFFLLAVAERTYKQR